MAGHNKISKIKHKKAATDAKKSKIFSEISRQITTEARAHGGDKEMPGMRALIEKARGANMPKENVERAIQKGVGVKTGAAFEVLYEAYGPGGCALLITGITDNKNRTSSEVKQILTKKGFDLATPGSASWAFSKNNDGGFKAENILSLSPEDTNTLISLIDDLESCDDIEEVYTNASIS